MAAAVELEVLDHFAASAAANGVGVAVMGGRACAAPLGTSNDFAAAAAAVTNDALAVFGEGVCAAAVGALIGCAGAAAAIADDAMEADGGWNGRFTALNGFALSDAALHVPGVATCAAGVNVLDSPSASLATVAASNAGNNFGVSLSAAPGGTLGAPAPAAGAASRDVLDDCSAGITEAADACNVPACAETSTVSSISATGAPLNVALAVYAASVWSVASLRKSAAAVAIASGADEAFEVFVCTDAGHAPVGAAAGAADTAAWCLLAVAVCPASACALEICIDDATAVTDVVGALGTFVCSLGVDGFDSFAASAAASGGLDLDPFAATVGAAACACAVSLAAGASAKAAAAGAAGDVGSIADVGSTGEGSVKSDGARQCMILVAGAVVESVLTGGMAGVSLRGLLPFGFAVLTVLDLLLVLLQLLSLLLPLSVSATDVKSLTGGRLGLPMTASLAVLLLVVLAEVLGW